MIRDFSEFITDVRGGNCHQELSQAINEVTSAAMNTGKVGSVTLTIKIKPQGEGQAAIVDQIKRTIPEPTKPETFCFVDNDGNLTRSDPRQAKIDDLKIVDMNTGEIKQVNR